MTAAATRNASSWMHRRDGFQLDPLPRPEHAANWTRRRRRTPCPPRAIGSAIAVCGDAPTHARADDEEGREQPTGRAAR